MYVRPGRLAQGVFLSVLDNLYIQEESVMEKKYDFQKAEKALEKMWQENEIYRYQNGKERKIFSIDTPPPTVSGIKICSATSRRISVKSFRPSNDAVMS